MAVKRLALCVGINNYEGQGSDLAGCVNDALDWSQFLQARGYETRTMLDSEVTKENFLSTLKQMVTSLRYGSRFVLTYSGHGSWVPDLSGDEEDKRDEVLVMSDFNYVSDDDLNSALSWRAYGSRVTTLSDSCHSGSVNRFVNTDLVPLQRRFLPPTYLGVDEDYARDYEQFPARTLGTRNNGVLISGCADEEYSYDAWFDSRPNGAFTRMALDTYVDGMSPKKWHEAIRTRLPNSWYPQSPQLQGTWYQKNKTNWF